MDEPVLFRGPGHLDERVDLGLANRLEEVDLPDHVDVEGLGGRIPGSGDEAQRGEMEYPVGPNRRDEPAHGRGVGDVGDQHVDLVRHGRLVYRCLQPADVDDVPPPAT